MTKPPEISGIWGAVASRTEMEAGWVLASGGMSNADVGVPRLVRPSASTVLPHTNWEQAVSTINIAHRRDGDIAVALRYASVLAARTAIAALSLHLDADRRCVVGHVRISRIRHGSCTFGNHCARRSQEILKR